MVLLVVSIVAAVDIEGMLLLREADQEHASYFAAWEDDASQAPHTMLVATPPGNELPVQSVGVQYPASRHTLLVDPEDYQVRVVQDSDSYVPALAPRLASVSSRAEQREPALLVINEFMADNDNVVADEFGEYDDLLEVYNPGTHTVDLGGMYLTDDLSNPTKFRIPDTLSIPADGFILFWADGEPEQGVYHTNFKLDRDGESVGLFDTEAAGNQPIDTYSFGKQSTDVSEGRCPDAGETWLYFTTPTPGITNEPCSQPPIISSTGHMPTYPSSTDAVSVTTHIIDDGNVVSATLRYDSGEGFVSLPLARHGSEGYSAMIPSLPDNTPVAYYIRAQDDDGLTATDPVDAPATTFGYLVGHQPPTETFEPLAEPPAISDTGHSPLLPSEVDQVTVTSTITDDGVVVSAALWFSAGFEFVPVPMTSQGGGTYSAVIPAQPDGAWVEYYVWAEDDAALTSTDPAGAPDSTYGYVVGYEPPEVYLNEFMADNETTLGDPDESSEFPDWIELYNPGPDLLDLGGSYLTDDLGDPIKFRISDGLTITPGGFLLFYADNDPEQGALHTNFKLDKDGEEIGLFGAKGTFEIDAVVFGHQKQDVAYGRLPDGSGEWVDQDFPTPGGPNGSCHIYLPLIASTPPAPPPELSIRLHCGGESSLVTEDGDEYQADRPWTEESRAGYIGGNPQVWEEEQWIPVGGTRDYALYKSQRRGWQEYRFSSIPADDYLVTLRFSEQVVHGPGLSVFDVTIEGRTVLQALDVFAQVGFDYSLTRRSSVTVSDGELNVLSLPIVGESHLAAIVVERRATDGEPPAKPHGLSATGSYDAVLLDWQNIAADDLDGYHVYRAQSPSGPYTRLTAEHLAYGSRYQDRSAVPHVTYHYRVSAVDVYGNEGIQSDSRSAAALAVGDATLPFYQLEVPAENLAKLYADPWADDKVPGTFTYEGQTYSVEVRFRGLRSRAFGKKSWKVKFPEASPFPGQDRINIVANWLDESLTRSKLSTDLFEASGIRPPQAEHVLLALNGEYLGLYARNEQVDETFLERTNRDAGASIYKVIHSFTKPFPDEAPYRDAYEKKTNEDLGYDDLISLIELINYTPDETFAYELGQDFDVAAFLDYYAVVVLTSNIDSASLNAYLLHDLTTDRWEKQPWDLDATFRGHDLAIDLGTIHSPEADGRSNILRTRVLDVPQFRSYYCRRLGEFMDTIFSDAQFHPRVDATYDAIENDVLRDWHKPGWEFNLWFTETPDEIKSFVTERKAFLRGEMASFCPTERPYLKINEHMADNGAVLADPADGDYEDWFEIYNAGLEDVNLQGFYLTDDPGQPTKFQIQAPITVPALGFVLLWADGEPWQGDNHVSFELEAGGGQLSIFDTDGTTQIDSHSYGSQSIDVSEGRYPDGVDRWMLFKSPTPGSPNVLLAPKIRDASHVPALPTETDMVTVTAVITDDGVVRSAEVLYSVNGEGFVAAPMAAKGTDLFAGEIPPQPDGSQVQYYVFAEDGDGQNVTAPPDARFGSYEYLVGYEPPSLFINEFMADNDSVIADEFGEYDDWLELYNPGPEPVDLGGMHLTDDLIDPTQFRITDGITIPAESYVLFWADNDPEQGPLHTNFRLSKDGDSLGLFGTDDAGNPSLDTYTFGAQTTDISEGRCPDGGDTWLCFAGSTPASTNEPCGAAPVITGTQHTPAQPSSTDRVTVTTNITDNGAVASALLWYDAGSGFVSVAMDSQVDGKFHATVPPQPDGTWVAYYVWAQDDAGFTATDPPLAPDDVFGYEVGYVPPEISINEFMAANVSTVADEFGEYDDWLELYNPSQQPIDLGGVYLTDDLSDPTRFRITDGITIPVEGFVVFWADNDPEQGPFHTNFALDADGEEIGLFGAMGTVGIDAVVFAAQTADISFGRVPDGTGGWGFLCWPTPGGPNIPCHRAYLPLIVR
jgi:hypothetical protein